MTCIVGIAHEGRVYLGGDSCGTDGRVWMVASNPKLFTVGDSVLIGCAGSFRMIDLLHYSFKVPTQSNKLSDDAFVRTKFIQSIKKTFNANDYTTMAEDSSEFLLGYHGKLYAVQEDCAVLNVPDWGFAIGSGETGARGSLWTTRDDPDVHRRIQIALEAAEATTVGVRSPWVFAEL